MIPHAYVGSMRIKALKQHPLGTSHHRVSPLAMVTLLAAAFGFTPQFALRRFQQLRLSRGRFNQPGITQHRRVTQWKQSDC
jgi:hypothetical protein